MDPKPSPDPQHNDAALPSVLAVDDDPSVLSSIRRVLRRSQIDVRTAVGGSEALKTIGPWLPDLILLDVSMPEFSGHVFLRRFRQKEAIIHRIQGRVLPPVPVMFVTGQAGQHQRIDGLAAGAVDYLLKPFDPQELRARVKAHLRQSRHARRAVEATAQAAANHPTLFSELSGGAA